MLYVPPILFPFNGMLRFFNSNRLKYEQDLLVNLKYEEEKLTSLLEQEEQDIKRLINVIDMIDR